MTCTPSEPQSDSPGDAGKNSILFTGATGMVGSAMLAELLSRGHRLLCIVRASTPTDARDRLAAALLPWGRSAEAFLQSGQLVALRGDLCRPLLGLDAAMIERLARWVGSVVHAAGSTAFSTRSDADLARVNVEGTRQVFELAAACGCLDWHLLSTAYVCGRCDHAWERLLPTRPDFRNEYEASKWTAEIESHQSAARQGAALTIYRPGVIVGHSASGVSTRFSGIYRVFRATALLARVAEARRDMDRHNIPLRIPASSESRPNLVFVDDMAREFAELFDRPEARGGIFHLTHPDPPANRAIQSALEAYYDIGGGTFIGSNTPLPKAGRTAYEDIFFDVVKDTESYILEAPVFDRTQVDRFVSRAPTPWSGSLLRRQIDFAERCAWRPPRRNGSADEHGPAAYDDYFRRFMPQMQGRFRLADLGDVNLDVRYVIGARGGADWFCHYRNGGLLCVGPSNGATPHVTYRLSPAMFWSIVSGKESAADAFLTGGVKLEGDIERGLKFAVVLQEFVRAFPYRCPER